MLICLAIFEDGTAPRGGMKQLREPLREPEDH